MDAIEKRKLSSLKKLALFNDVFYKLTVGKLLNADEKTYILSCAIVIITTFEKDRRHKSYLEMAYYIILKYAVTYNDYQPLYDFSMSFGFFPIADAIVSNDLIENSNIYNFLLHTQLINYKKDNIIETIEQKKTRTELLSDKNKEISYIAPTSFGKSSIILEHIKMNATDKIGIIVPTKSLLNQTYKMVRNEGLNYRIIIHDDMYDNEKRIIGILTQERALRMLENEELYFDILYIDEAHNILNDGLRSLLISRLIRKNKQKNPQQKVVYLSPLIEKSESLIIDKGQSISEHKINYNIKEPEYFEYTEEGQVVQYNRFINEFYPINISKEMFNYIEEKASYKTFIYIRRPMKIEQFSNQFSEKINLSIIPKEIIELIKILEKYVHKEFYMIKFLKKGIIYLHGKLPDRIKEYLEYKYNSIPDIKYVVANNVILEGINLPITTLHILNVTSLDEKELTNLIGRVNRLNSIFNEDENRLNFLIPQIHFINNSEYNRINGKMKNKIVKLRSKVFGDVIKNPTLSSYDIDKLKLNFDAKYKLEQRNMKILENEEMVLTANASEHDKFKVKLIEYGLTDVYDITDELVEILRNRIYSINNSSQWHQINILEKMNMIFLEDIQTIKDFEIKRLKEAQARKYYIDFIIKSKKSLNENIAFQYRYFKDLQNSPDKSLFYIGLSYGEKAKITEDYPTSNFKTYVELRDKSDSELINLAIVKIKMEEDFVSFKLNRFFNLMLDLRIITDEEYNLTIYGTSDSKKLRLIKIGLSINVISRLENDNQLQNIFFDKNKNLMSNQAFEQYKEIIDDFFRFELNKFL